MEKKKLSGNSLYDNVAGTILIPIDFSEYSEKACQVGFSYAARHHLKVIILNSYIGQYFSDALPLGRALRSERKYVEYVHEKKQKAILQMEQFQQSITRQIAEGTLPNVAFDCKVVEGIPEEAILESAAKCNPMLIVMGTRGKHKKEQDLIGSVTAEVLDSGKFPMLIVPEGGQFDPISQLSNVIFYSNLEQADVSSLDVFVREFSRPQLTVTIIHVSNKRERFIPARMEALLNYCKGEYPETSFNHKIFDEANFLEAFDQYLRHNDTDIVVIPNKKRNIFARLFNPSLAHRILFHTDIPLLVLPNER